MNDDPLSPLSPEPPTQPTSHQPQYPQYPQYSQPQRPQQPSYPQPYAPGASAGPYPPQPAYPPYPPQPQVIYTQNQSFTSKAVIAFLLYWLGYIPGLIFNVMFLNEARRVEAETGRAPSGIGCLWATLIGGLIPALLFIGFCALTLIGAMVSNGGAH